MFLPVLIGSTLLASWFPATCGEESLYAQTGNGLHVYDPDSGIILTTSRSYASRPKPV